MYIVRCQDMPTKLNVIKRIVAIRRRSRPFRTMEAGTHGNEYLHDFNHTGYIFLSMIKEGRPSHGQLIFNFRTSALKMWGPNGRSFHSFILDMSNAEKERI